MKDIKFDEVQNLLDNGKAPEEIFDWVDDEEEGGFRRVCLNNKHNYLDENNKLLSETWFDNVGDFWGGFGRVGLDRKWNFIKPNGEFLSDTWFDWCEHFENGLGLIKLNGKWNKIKPDGTFLSEEWFDVYYVLKMHWI